MMTLLAAAAVLTATAGNVSRQQARQRAAHFAAQRSLTLAEGPVAVKGRRSQAAGTTDAEPLYVFNTAGGRGFVVVSGDDRTDAILGYTLRGSYNADSVPANFRFWMEQMAAEIEALPRTDADADTDAATDDTEQAAASPAIAVHPAVSPLIVTTWDQGNNDHVYNAHCPLIGTNRTLTGCVATCGAQIMYYYRYPQASTTALPGYTSGSMNLPDLPAVQFQWNKMKTSYSVNDTDAEAVSAVADLMLYTGYAAQMNYGVGGSSASAAVLAEGMGKYFGYDPQSWQNVFRADYSAADWDAIIYNEISNGRPVIYSGDTPSNSGHAFLCDGYDGAGLYHFNWGWGGVYNGYFRLQATAPNYAMGYNYINDIDAIIGLQPLGYADVSQHLVAKALDAQLSGTTAMMYLQNTNAQTLGFGLGMGELMDDGTLRVVDKRYEHYKNSPLAHGYYKGIYEFDLAALGLAEGTHRLVPISLLNGESQWQRCLPMTLWYEVTVTGGKATVTQHPVANVEATAFTVQGRAFEGSTLTVNVTLTNHGDDFLQPVYLYASQDADNPGDSYRYVTGTALPAGSTDDVTCYFCPESAGTWYLTAIASDGTLLGRGTIEVSPEPEGTVTLQKVSSSYVALSDGQLSYTITIKNTGETTYYRKLQLQMWYDNTAVDSFWRTTSIYDTDPLEIVPGEEMTLQFAVSGLQEGVTYSFNPLYKQTFSDSMNDWVNINRYINAETFTYHAPVPGDADGDGQLTAGDVEALANHLAGKTPDGFLPSVADANGDGRVDVQDIVLLVRHLIGQ